MATCTANDVNILVDESRSRTDFKVTRISHTWTISNFKYCKQGVGESLNSVTFPLNGDEEHKTTEWCIKLYPKGYNKGCDEYVSVDVVLVATKKTEVKGKLTVGIINAKGARHTLASSPVPEKFVVNSPLGRCKFVRQNNLFNKTSSLMQDNNLVLFCEIEVLTDISKTSEYLKIIQSTEPKNHPLAKIEHLLESKKFSDITITAGGKEFQAHKIVLAQSPVFSAMFDHDMKEKKQNCIDIIDIEDEVVKEMLRFLYTGKVNNMQDIVVGLLAAANKYALEELKIMCEEALRAHLTIENAAETLILADLYSADQLKARVISFICSHASEVVTTTGFKLMVQSHASLFSDVFCQMALRKNGDSHDVSETDAAASKLHASATNRLSMDTSRGALLNP